LKRLVFVYGTLKRGFWNNYLLEGSELLGEGTTLERFSLYTVGFPYAVPDGGGLPLRGEVYRVDEETLKRLDALEGYPNHYKRKLTEVKLDDGRLVKALIYYAERPRGKPLSPKSGVYSWEGE
jgi:gamma-glutamylcyclotransferase (GGCT)/AIG2-like uncharacterized protein YtfP